MNWPMFKGTNQQTKRYFYDEKKGEFYNEKNFQ